MKKKNNCDKDENRSDDYFYDLQGLLPQIPQEEKKDPIIKEEKKEEENTPYF